MRFITICLSLLAPATAFVAPRLPSTPRTPRTALKMQIALDEDIGAGVSAPMGYFDPLGLSRGKDKATVKKWRESELKHGRVAMLASLGMIVQERFHPLFGLGDKDLGGSFMHFQEVEGVVPGFLAGLIFFIGFVEGNNILTGWQPKEEVADGDIAGLREDYLTGDLGLDPFNVKADKDKFYDLRTKELNNGRLAMIAVIGQWIVEVLGRVQELT